MALKELREEEKNARELSMLGWKIDGGEGEDGRFKFTRDLDRGTINDELVAREAKEMEFAEPGRQLEPKGRRGQPNHRTTF